MSNKELRFATDPEAVDSIKLEVDAASPGYATRLKRIAGLANKTIVNSYGAYIPPHVIEQNKNLAHRLLLPGDGDLIGLFNAWVPKKVRSSPFGIGLGISMPVGRLIGIDVNASEWDRLPDEYKSYYINSSQLESEELARMAVNFLGHINTLTHETLHQYEDPFVPPALNEIGTLYYSRAVLTKMNLVLEHCTVIDELAIPFYQDLYKIFGRVLHQVYFGTAEAKDKIQVFKHSWDKLDKEPELIKRLSS